jgi:hypothetical protein
MDVALPPKVGVCQVPFLNEDGHIVWGSVSLDSTNQPTISPDAARVLIPGCRDYCREV